MLGTKKQWYKRTRNASRVVKRTLRDRYLKSNRRGASSLKYAQIYKDLKFLKSVINAEKKNYIITASSSTVAQLNGSTSSGHFGIDITPVPGQGTTDITRNGDSIKISSLYAKLQFWQQSASDQPIKVKVVLLQVLGTPQSVNTVITQFLKTNPMCNNSIYDFNSAYNPDYFGQYRIIKTQIMKIQDQYSSQVGIKDMEIKLRLNHHVRFAANSTTISNGQLIMLVLADSGNSNPSTVSTVTGAPVLTANSGLNFNYNYNWYFYDN